MSEWCQNKRCPEKKNKNQIRGSKGAKYYQSNKASGYYGYWCSMGCREEWFNEHKDACINHIGFIPKQTLPLEDAWFVEYHYGDYDWSYERQERVCVRPANYYLVNKLMGIKQVITKEQAQNPADRRYDYVTINPEEAKTLAIELGLAKAS